MPHILINAPVLEEHAFLFGQGLKDSATIICRTCDPSDYKIIVKGNHTSSAAWQIKSFPSYVPPSPLAKSKGAPYKAKTRRETTTPSRSRSWRNPASQWECRFFRSWLPRPVCGALCAWGERGGGSGNEQGRDREPTRASGAPAPPLCRPLPTPPRSRRLPARPCGSLAARDGGRGGNGDRGRPRRRWRQQEERRRNWGRGSRAAYCGAWPAPLAAEPGPPWLGSFPRGFSVLRLCCDRSDTVGGFRMEQTEGETEKEGGARRGRGSLRVGGGTPGWGRGCWRSLEPAGGGVLAATRKKWLVHSFKFFFVQ